MKKYRLINLAAWLIVAAALISWVCYEWHSQGAGFYSLFAGAAYYTVFPAIMCYGVDSKIKEKMKQ